MADSVNKQLNSIGDIAPENIPVHIAIIPDGNRRWARSKGLPIGAGHKKGVDAFKNIVEHCGNIGVKYVTFYAFSSENNKRSPQEVGELMSLLMYFLKNFEREMGKGRHKIRIRVIGRREGLSPELQSAIKEVEEKTSLNDDITVNICINYGGRDEITDIVKKISRDAINGKISAEYIENLNSKDIAKATYSGDIPDPDILIRTSGEKRLSNFLLWGLAYTEFFFPEKYWPEFEPEDLDEIIVDFTKRNRRFGV